MSTVKRNDEYNSSSSITASSNTTGSMIEFEMKDSTSVDNYDDNNLDKSPVNGSQETIAETEIMINEGQAIENTSVASVSTPVTSVSLSPQTPADHSNSIINSPKLNEGEQNDEQPSIDSLSVQSPRTYLSTSYSLASNNIVRINE